MGVAVSILCWLVAEVTGEFQQLVGGVLGEQVALGEGSDCQDSVAFGGVYRQA